MKKRHLEALIAAMDIRLGQLEREVAQARANQREFNLKIRDAVGGAIWRTQQGHTRGIAFFSDRHLANLMKFPGCEGTTREAVRREIERRAIDKQFAVEEAKAEANLQRARARGRKSR